MIKSKIQIPLNQELSKVVLFTENDNFKNIENLKEDIKNTIRINNLEIKEKPNEKSFKEKPDLIENIDDLNIKVYLFN